MSDARAEHHNHVHAAYLAPLDYTGGAFQPTTKVFIGGKEWEPVLTPEEELQRREWEISLVLVPLHDAAAEAHEAFIGTDRQDRAALGEAMERCMIANGDLAAGPIEAGRLVDLFDRIGLTGDLRKRALQYAGEMLRNMRAN